jgi:uncharacterized phosphosugar-binding protein
MSAREYLDAIQRRLDLLGGAQLPAIEQAGQAVADAIASGHRIWVSRTTHCLDNEVTSRAGGFMAIHVLDDPISIEAGDLVMIGTNAGTTVLTVELANIARDRGATSVALTQLAYETDPGAPAEHPSGKKLNEVADIVIDLGGQFGDGELAFEEPGNPMRILPGSGAAVVIAAWMILSEATDRLVALGKPPLFWQSMQIPGATPRNLALLSQYRRDHLGYSTEPASAASANGDR